MYLILNNYDSFVFNLADYIHQLGHQTHIAYHNQITIQDIEQLKPKGIFISPGPNHPKDIPNIIKIIHHFAGQYPILGICLGHQPIGYAYGATIGRTQPAHGYHSDIIHNDPIIFNTLKTPLAVGRYHSLSILKDHHFPKMLEITAYTHDNAALIMAIKHKHYPIFGVQFHPESILTEQGIKIIKNFIYLNI